LVLEDEIFITAIISSPFKIGYEIFEEIFSRWKSKFTKSLSLRVLLTIIGFFSKKHLPASPTPNFILTLIIESMERPRASIIISSFLDLSGTINEALDAFKSVTMVFNINLSTFLIS